MTNKFKAVAYFKGDNLTEGWPERAAQLLAAAPGCQVACSEAGGGTTLSIRFADGEINILVGNGSTVGSVKPGPASAVLVVCLVALRKALGGIEIVDDAQASVPRQVRPINPLYQGDWARIESVAEALGCWEGKKLFADNPALRAKLF